MVTNSKWINNYKLSVYQLFVLIFIFIFSINLSAQTQKSVESDLFENIQNSIRTSPKFYLGFDNKNSFISNRSGWFIGVKAGLEYNKIFRYGLGFYVLYNKKIK